MILNNLIGKIYYFSRLSDNLWKQTVRKAVFHFRGAVIGSKKTVTNQTATQANTFDYKTPPSTPELDALKTMKATTNPDIPYEYANRKTDLENSYNNPLGAYTSPAVRDAVSRSAIQGLDQQQAQAQADSQYQADNTNYARQAGIAAATAPQLIQTGGTSTGTGTQTQSGGFLQSLALGALSGGASVASSKLGK